MFENNRSLKDALMGFQKTNQNMMIQGLQKNQANQKSNFKWLHSYDFQRWFQMQVLPKVMN